ncbi:hypothetical protein RclHR1_00390006 [Rhizophagus clarus]|uniref:F-box domain-containing protein n=1 Tax=Rhizophagus clarus TaxID=94130 RepID=A0A2Z6RVM2_9GLOM|nr:hypothetical protein RclHR1_00390006 [Rhizophagus clarus]GES74481.1 hypothetical protein GLOIN_2v1883258 [Rhizophagus clarus]
MTKLNRDIFYVILNELQDDKKTLYSCLLVNKTWSEIIIPILWRDPWKYLKKGNEQLLLKVITTNLISKQNFNIKIYQRPLFDYISFCRHLNLYEIKRIINTIDEESEMRIFKDKILDLFINENTKYTHLYIPYQFDNQIHLIPGAKRCFSELKFLRCNTSINDNVLSGLIEICKSIKELELFINVHNNNYGIVRLIETQKNLFDIRFITYSQSMDGTFCKILENSLNKHASTIQYFKMTTPPTTNILSSFVNLKELELNGNKLEDLGNLFLPSLRILKASNIQVEYLTNLIKNTSGYLVEIKIDNTNHDEINNKRIIRAIYQNCPKLKYLKLLLRNSNIFELEKLLINCQCLNGLYIFNDNFMENVFDWDYLFEILTTSSPISLFKFKFGFGSSKPIKLESLKKLFDNWKGRQPMLLQLSNISDSYYCINIEDMKIYIDLIKEYKLEGIVKNYNNDWYGRTYKGFEWF